jgi:hypothetical protein
VIPVVDVGGVVCPRCGARGSVEEYEVNGRVYLRVRHYAGKRVTRSGKVVSRYRYCYLGPKEDYLHAAPLLRQPLTNVLEHDYLTEASEAVEKVLSAAAAPLTEEARDRAAAALRELIRLCEEWSRRARRLLENLERGGQ